jgi:hypothetical protein
LALVESQREAARATQVVLSGGRVLLRRPAGPAHRDAVRLDHVGRLGQSVLARLQAPARVALTLERARIALLFRSAPALLPPPSSEQACGLPAKVIRYTARVRRGPFV